MQWFLNKEYGQLLKRKLKKHIKRNFKFKADFARSEGVKPQQITKWLNIKCIVVKGVLYSPRRKLNKGDENENL